MQAFKPLFFLFHTQSFSKNYHLNCCLFFVFYLLTIYMLQVQRTQQISSICYWNNNNSSSNSLLITFESIDEILFQVQTMLNIHDWCSFHFEDVMKLVKANTFSTTSYIQLRPDAPISLDSLNSRLSQLEAITTVAEYSLNNHLMIYMLKHSIFHDCESHLASWKQPSDRFWRIIWYVHELLRFSTCIQCNTFYLSSSV